MFRKLWKRIKSFFKRKPYEPGGVVPSLGNKKLLRNNYKELYESMIILPEYKVKVDWYTTKALSQKHEYIKVEELLTVPWEIVAALHSLESTFDLDKQILNGQKWDQETTWVPKGLGPWISFESSCVSAFNRHKPPIKYTIEEVSNFAERWNGGGYAKRNKLSPYLYSFSNLGLKTGKFVSDGRYSSTAISKQCGFLVLLKALDFKFEE